MSKKIYVINRASHDYGEAERFGHVEYLSEGPINRYATNKIYRQMEDKLNQSNPEDYILLTGLTVMSSIACAIFAHKHGRLNLLIFRPDSHTYAERRLIIGKKEQ